MIRGQHLGEPIRFGELGDDAGPQLTLTGGAG